MAIFFKFDILAALKEAGYTTYRLRREKIFGESTIQRFRSGGTIDTVVIDKLCALLSCQPGDIIQYKEEENE